jgi:hypothetical protein
MGVRTAHFGHLPPSPRTLRAPTMNAMNSAAHIEDHAADLLGAAQAIQEAAGRPGSSRAATATLASLEEALQALSASWYQVAADAGILQRRREAARLPQPWPAAENGLTREQEVRLIGTLHDVAAAFARCARVCRDARPTLASLIDGRSLANHPRSESPPFKRHERPTGRAA